MLFEEFYITFKPKRKKFLAGVILVLCMALTMGYVSETSYEYGTSWDLVESGYESYVKNGTIEGPHTLLTLITRTSTYPMFWNLSVSENVSVYTRSYWTENFQHNGTGGTYEGNSTFVSIYIMLEGTEGNYSFGINTMRYDMNDVLVRELVTWRFMGTIAAVILGFASASILFLLYDEIRKADT